MRYMRDEVAQLIREIYVEKKTDLFVQGCHRKLSFLDDLIRRIGEMTDKVDRWSLEKEPAEEIHISVNMKTIGNIQIKYESILYISKIAKYYYLQHEFSINNPDDERVAPDLDGFSDEAYNKRQFRLNDMIDQFLAEQGYERLSYSDIEEEFFPEPIPLKECDREKYLTVFQALFMDYTEIND